ncbi:phage tail protein [Wolbachia endosymbiont (group A) of Pogonocherus hispidulus]|uniref:phage tail protein n=1 Tax=Wolbachia endosymbiont (group A) of Pogonocherus hispidulus TaxID=3066136 RepID=UPI0033402AF2
MRVEIGISGSIEKIIQSIEASQAKITRATVRALNKTALWTKEQATKELSKDTQIKRQLIRKRLWIIRATRNYQRALVRIGLYGVKSSKLGDMKQMAKGAKAGKHMFEGAFIAKMPTGHRGIFRRRGRTALPIHEVTVPIGENVQKIVKEMASYKTGKVFEEYFEHELNVLLKKQ